MLHQNSHDGNAATSHFPRSSYRPCSWQPWASGQVEAEPSTRGRSLKPLGQGQLDFTSRLNVRSDVTALDLLCGREAVSRLKTAVEELNTRDSRSFLRGYRLAVAAPLNELLWFVVSQAEQLGLQHDDRLYNWLHYRTPARDETLLSAVSDPTSDLGRLCYGFHDLTIALRRAEGGLPDTIAAIEKCRVTVKLFDEVLAGTEVVSLDTGEELPRRESLLRLCLAERVLDYVEYDPSIMGRPCAGALLRPVPVG